MNTQRPRLRWSGRHLLAVCTFLGPLGLLAWLGAAEIRRQGERARVLLEGQALTFLRSASVAVEQQLEARLAPVMKRSAEALAELAPGAAVRELRGPAPEVLDVLLLDERGGLLAPRAPPVDLGLPLFRSVRARAGPGAEALQAAEVLALRGELQAAAGLLAHALEQLPPRARRPAAQAAEGLELEARLRFQYGAVLRRLGRDDEARQQYQALRTLLRSQRGATLADPSLLGLDLLTDAALAELGSADDCLRLLRSIADGGADELHDGLLQAIVERLIGRIPEGSPEREPALAAAQDDARRRHARAFCTDYQALLLETVRRRLPQAGTAQPLLHACGAVEVGSLLAVRPAAAAEQQRHGCAHVCVRLHLGLLLGDALEPFLEDRGRGFALVVEDGDGFPMLGPADAAPVGFEPPMVQTHGLRLRALPANAEVLVQSAEAEALNRALLLIALFVVALGGAAWLWRSVSREAELAAMKVDFVSSVSHELKTPLSLIRMYGETLALGRAQDEAQVQRFGGIVAREADRLSAMIQRMLDFSRQQAGTLTYAPEPRDLGQLLAGLIDDYRPHLEGRGAELTAQLEPGLRASVDASALEGAMANLLENAAAYQRPEDPDRRIELSLRARNGTAEIDVCDRGRGIPEPERERVFDSFYRASNAGRTRGAGLGLSLVRHFAAAHGGDVRALPREGGGSILRLTLPLLPDRA